MKRFLIPNFLQRFDRYLLKQYPIIWETKLHYVLFYSSIVANGLLCVIGFLIPVSKKNFPDYADFMFPTVGWGLVLAFLALAYYTYQQSFVRIRVYVMRENILRYGLYIIAVTSILANVLTLPHTVRYRVVGLFDKEEFKKDFEDLYRWKYLNALTKYVKYDASFAGKFIIPNEELSKYVNESTLRKDIYHRNYHYTEINNHYFLDILHQSPINQAQESKHLAQAFQDLDEIIDDRKIKNISLKYEELHHLEKRLDSIIYTNKLEVGHSDFKEMLKSFTDHKQMFVTLDHTLAIALDFLKPDSTRMVNAIQNHPKWHPALKRQLINQVSLKEVLYLDKDDFKNCRFVMAIPATINLVKKYAEYPNDEYFGHLHNRLHQLLFYHNSDNFLLNAYYPIYQVDDFDAKENEIFEKIKEKTIYYEGELSRLEAIKRYIREFTNESILKKEIELISDNYFLPNHFAEAYTILVLFLSLLILTIKAYTLRNLFISALGMLASLFLTALFFYHRDTYLSEWRDAVLSQLCYWNIRETFSHGGLQHQVLFMPWVVPLMILFTFGLFALRVWIGNLNRKWLQTFWVFMTVSALTSGAFTSFILLFQRETESYQGAFLLSQVIYLYPLFAPFVLGMYLFYNRMLVLPQKK
jgi:hypothetical protein